MSTSLHTDITTCTWYRYSLVSGDQARNQGGQTPWKIFAHSLKKYDGHSLKNLDHSQKTLRPP